MTVEATTNKNMKLTRQEDINDGKANCTIIRFVF